MKHFDTYTIRTGVQSKFKVESCQQFDVSCYSNDQFLFSRIVYANKIALSTSDQNNIGFEGDDIIHYICLQLNDFMLVLIVVKADYMVNNLSKIDRHYCYGYISKDYGYIVTDNLSWMFLTYSIDSFCKNDILNTRQDCFRLFSLLYKKYKFCTLKISQDQWKKLLPKTLYTEKESSVRKQPFMFVYAWKCRIYNNFNTN